MSELTADERAALAEALASRGCWDFEECCWTSFEAMVPALERIVAARVAAALAPVEYDRFRYFHLWNDLRAGLTELAITGQIDDEVQKFLLRFHLAAAAARCGQPDHGAEDHECPREEPIEAASETARSEG